MMNQEVRDKFTKMIYGFYRENKENTNAADMALLLRTAFEQFVKDYDSKRNHYGTAPEVTDEEKKDFREFWDGIVQGIIDFVNKHPHLKQVMTDRQNVMAEEWKKNLSGEYAPVPDVRFSFGVDGLDSSLEYGEWVSATDSYCALSVGNEPIIEMC